MASKITATYCVEDLTASCRIALASSGNSKHIEFRDNVLGHLILASGLHLSTHDLQTGIPLLSLGYDTQERLVTITGKIKVYWRRKLEMHIDTLPLKGYF
jgi:hypothetical protein